MKKINLSLEELKVESFTTDEKKKQRGTVNANVPQSEQYWCPEETHIASECYSWCATCAPTCGPVFSNDPVECP